MKADLRRFFDSMDAYFERPGPERLERLYAEHPGWDASRERVALYGGFVRGHVRTTLEKLFPLVRKAVGDTAWDALVEGFTAARPGRHHEINRLGEGFPAFIADVAGARGLAAWVPALARFEWTDFAVFGSEESTPEKVTRLTANPTLVVLQHAFQLCAFVRASTPPEAPEPGEELALLWRHPEQLATFFMAATPPVLLVLKMAVEGLSTADVVTATGMAESAVREVVDRCARDGLVLVP